jgi:hypothetical protein
MVNFFRMRGHRTDNPADHAIASGESPSARLRISDIPMSVTAVGDIRCKATGALWIARPRRAGVPARAEARLTLETSCRAHIPETQVMGLEVHTARGERIAATPIRVLRPDPNDLALCGDSRLETHRFGFDAPGLERRAKYTIVARVSIDGSPPVLIRSSIQAPRLHHP